MEDQRPPLPSASQAEPRAAELQFFFDHMGDLVFLLDPVGTILRSNAAAQKRLGHGARELQGLSILDLHPPEQREEAAEALFRLLAGEQELYNLPLLARDGGRVETETRATRGTWEGQEVLLTVSRDVTESLRNLRALQESEARMRAVLSALPDLIFLNSREGVFLDHHAPEPGHLLVPPEQFLGKGLADLFQPDLARRFMEAYAAALDEGTLQRVEYLLSRNGEPRHFEARIVPCGEDRALSVIRDMTERHAFVARLRESEARFHDLAELLPEATYETDPEGRLVYLNEAGMAAFGHAGDLGELSLLDLLAPPDRAKARQVLLYRVREGEGQRLECRGQRADASLFPVLVHACAIQREGACVGTRGVIMDMTESKKAQRELADTKSLLEAAFEQNPNPMVLFTVPDRILRALNPPCLELLGILDEVCPIGLPLAQVRPSWQDLDLEGRPLEDGGNPMLLALRGVSTHGREICIRRKDGSLRKVLAHGRPVINAYGKQIAGMVVLRDLGDYRIPGGAPGSL